MTFKPNPTQLKHLRERGNHRRNLILKYRQGGITTLYAIDELDEALWVPGMSCAIIAHEQGTLDKIFEIVKRAYENLPDLIKPETQYDNKREYTFKRRFDGVNLDSSIYVALKLRGGTVQRLHITESAYIKDRQELASGSKQAVPKDGYISEETTANGYEDFYDLYEESRAISNPTPYDYRTYFYAWFEDPEYFLPGTLEIQPEDKTEYGNELELQTKFNLTDGQLIWRRWKIRELKTKGAKEGIALTGLQLFKQEYPSTIQEAFQSGMGNVFEGELVEAIVTTTGLTREQLFFLIERDYPQHAWQATKDTVDQLLKLGVSIWELPKPNYRYTLGCDPSDGLGSDFGPVDVWRVPNDPMTEKIKQVAQYYGKSRPDDLAEVCALLGTFYNRAFAGVENNMLTTILFLIKIYDNYYYQVTVDEKTQKRTKKPGWNTNSKTRNLMIDEFIIKFEENELEINSPITQKEMRTFITKDTGKREHANGKFDDTLFAAFIAIIIIRYLPRMATTYAHKPSGF